jgi:hypothetical protein
LATEASFDDVNGRLEKKLDIIRFRPNIVVGGTVAWDEDDWKLIFIHGIGVFHVIARCPRCQLPKYFPTISLPFSCLWLLLFLLMDFLFWICGVGSRADVVLIWKQALKMLINRTRH